MRTENGDGDKEVVNRDLQVNHHDQSEEEQQQQQQEDEETETFENNNNLEIEENNNYQTFVGYTPCTGCSCLSLNQNLQRNRVSPHCTCAKPIRAREWIAAEQCCYVLSQPPIQEETEVEIVSQEIPTSDDDEEEGENSAKKKEVVTEEEETIRAALKTKKRKLFSQPAVSPIKRLRVTPRKKLNLGKGRKRKPAAQDKENIPETKKPRSEICFIDCGPSESTKKDETKSPDPLGKLSLSSRDKILAIDKMYDHRQFPDPVAVQASGYYAGKLGAGVEDRDTTTSSSTNAVTATVAATTTLDSNKTIATLCNIGNSCYLNSVVYTLRFAPLFLHKLHHLIEDMATIYVKLNPTKHKSSSLGRNVSLWYGHNGRSWSSKDLTSLGSISGNDMQPKNNRLIVTEKLHELYQNLYKNEAALTSEPLHAGAFLQAIQEVCSIFEGNQQQDAHECLMCILDSIRETCDTLATAIIDNPESLVSDYGVSTVALLEESRDELTPMPPVSSSTAATSQLKSGYKGLFSRKSKRKKSEDERTAATVSAGDSPVKERSGGGNGDDSETTSPTDAAQGNGFAKSPEEHTRTLLLKALTGSSDNITDKDKLKKAVCQRLGLNFFNEDFEGVSVSSIKCLTCETVRNCEETMIDVSVPITGHENPDAMSNPQQFFQNSFITKEYFRGENKYRCESCFGYTEAIRSISYEVLPRLLVIHLKRFSGGMEKINSYIPTPFTLHCFCNRCIELRDEDKRHIYKLYSVITHVGATMSVGHYVAYTCSLDILNEAGQCPNQREKLNGSSSKVTPNGTSNGGGSSSDGGGGDKSSRGTVTSTNGNASKKPLIRFFSNRKANSSGDMSKNLKGVNELVNKVVANGFEKLNLNTNLSTTTSPSSSPASCHGAKCCAIHVKNSKLLSNNGNNTTFVSYLNGHHGNGDSPPHPQKASSELSLSGERDDTSISCYDRRVYGPSHISQDYWYMCDDDKIKVMSQQQFEDYLSPTRKNMITPYLLFYARFDNQT